MTGRSQALNVTGRVLIVWTAFWLLLATLLVSVSSVVNPGDFLSDEAGAGAKAIGYALSATIVAALIAAVWDGLIRTPGGRLTAILCAAVFALALLTTAVDPGSDDSVLGIAAVGLFTLGAGVLGGLLRARATPATGIASQAGERAPSG